MKNIADKNKLAEQLFLNDGKEMTAILQKAVRKALLEHKRAGNPIASWQDGRVVIIPPDQIPVDEDEDEDEDEK